jgi:large subunit ribosomal protein L20
MARVKGGVTANKRRKKILSEVKGYRFGRSKKKRQAREAIYHAQLHAFAHRRDKKNDFRQLWIVRLNAALKEQGLRYNSFIKLLKDKGILINRTMLAMMAGEQPEAFARFLAKAK